MMWHGDWTGADWAWMSVAMVLFWTAVVAGMIWLVRALGDRGRTSSGEAPGQSAAPPRPSAKDILDEQYARGELSEQEYRTRRDVLSGQ